ncbi:MAG: restriction endonuclease subunit M [Eubacterium sp.]|nr:restriction endonuclease subunit M [Eubacterium sp.]
MNEIFNLNEYPVVNVLGLLLKDKTTKKNIIFATNAYSDIDSKITEKTQITEALLLKIGFDKIKTRVDKSEEDQVKRTRKKAEVFTPSWICNKMNNHCDTEWFGREGVFNTEKGQTWVVNELPIEFSNENDWKKYVDSKRLEITCGEAPYIVSRYDVATGEFIEINNRIGILDRKLRVVNENTDTKEQWVLWVTRAFQSVYGYEFQGDNVLIARVNLLLTFTEYYKDRWGDTPEDNELKKIANIIVWNIWQMDGITGTVPFGKPKEENRQLTFFDYMQGINDTEDEEMDCIIRDWRSDRTLTYRSIKEGK